MRPIWELETSLTAILHIGFPARGRRTTNTCIFIARWGTESFQTKKEHNRARGHSLGRADTLGMG